MSIKSYIEIDGIRFVRWEDSSGHVHLVRENGCVLCKHCIDIFMDPLKGNEIYMCICELEMEPTMDCKKFEKEGEQNEQTTD